MSTIDRCALYAKYLLAIVALSLSSGARSQDVPSTPSGANRHLLIVLDGLRPDYVTAELTPNIYALAGRGAVFTNHHAAFPTLTNANAAAIASGAYPENSGVLGNAVYLPEIDRTRFLSIQGSTRRQLHESAVGGLLTATSFIESIQLAGLRTLVVHGPGLIAALGEDSEVAVIGEFEVNPPALESMIGERLGTWPERDPPNHARNEFIVTSFLDIGLPEVDPVATFMWLIEPDASAHNFGVGSPTMISALRHADSQIGRILAELDRRGVLRDFNIWIASDHGFSTRSAAFDPSALIEQYQRTLEDGSPRIVADAGYIYVRDGDSTVIEGIVRALQEEPTVGAIFTRSTFPGGLEGAISGTLGFDGGRMGHERVAQIFYAPSWSDTQNDFGFRGSEGALNATFRASAVAVHGGSSPYAIHNTLIAAGPDIKNASISTPTGNVDIAPTILHLLGVAPPASMQGRVLREALPDGPDPADMSVVTTQITVENAYGYRVTAHFTSVEGVRYFDYSEADRSTAK